MSTRRDRGQAVPWMMLVIALGVALVLVIGRLATVVDDAARARTAADAAALAGAAGGEAAARDLAEANGGVLVEFHSSGQRTVVVVAVGGVRARAAASADVRWVPG